jgi:hypothetical protein
MVSTAKTPEASDGNLGAGQTSSPPPIFKGESLPSGGMFKITGQRQEQPVVAILNEADTSLRFVLQDSRGQLRTEMIAPGETKELIVAEGSYIASVDAPDDLRIYETNGTVDAKRFHRYQADFRVVTGSGPPQPFHIGD